MASASLSWKSGQVGAISVDERQGLVTAIPAVTGVVDDVGDRLVPGCFVRTLSERTPKVVASHEWTAPVGRCLSARELLPGSLGIPSDLRVIGAGCLLVEVQFNLETQRGAEAFSDCVFFGTGMLGGDARGAAQAWSIGYSERVSKPGDDGANDVLDLDLFECSPVLWGANGLARSLAIKSARQRTVPIPPSLYADLLDLLDDVQVGWGNPNATS